MEYADGQRSMLITWFMLLHGCLDVGFLRNQIANSLAD